MLLSDQSVEPKWTFPYFFKWPHSVKNQNNLWRVHSIIQTRQTQSRVMLNNICRSKEQVIQHSITWIVPLKLTAIIFSMWVPWYSLGNDNSENWAAEKRRGLRARQDSSIIILEVSALLLSWRPWDAANTQIIHAQSLCIRLCNYISP